MAGWPSASHRPPFVTASLVLAVTLIVPGALLALMALVPAAAGFCLLALFGRRLLPEEWSRDAADLRDPVLWASVLALAAVAVVVLPRMAFYTLQPTGNSDGMQYLAQAQHLLSHRSFFAIAGIAGLPDASLRGDAHGALWTVYNAAASAWSILVGGGLTDEASPRVAFQLTLRLYRLPGRSRRLCALLRPAVPRHHRLFQRDAQPAVHAPPTEAKPSPLLLVQPLADLAGRLAGRRPKSLLKGDRVQAIVSKPASFDCDRDARRAQAVASMLAQDWIAASELAKRNGAAFVAVLQPHAYATSSNVAYLGLDADANSRARLKQQYDVIYPLIRAEGRRAAERHAFRFVDLSGALDWPGKAFYIDFCHVSPNGNAALAGRIAAVLKGDGGRVGPGPVSVPRSGAEASRCLS